MATRRHGSPFAFWGTSPSVGEVVGVGGLSRKVPAGQDADQIVLYINTDTATTITILVAHGGALTSEGNEANFGAPPADAFFFPLFYTGIASTITFAGAGTQAYMIPDWAASWIRLKSSAGATIIAGIEVAAV